MQVAEKRRGEILKAQLRQQTWSFYLIMDEETRWMDSKPCISTSISASFLTQERLADYYLGKSPLGKWWLN